MDIDEIRRDNIRHLEKLHGPKLAQKAGMSPTQFYNLRDGVKDSKTGKPRGMRKETAWRIEDAAGVPRGFLDTQHNDLQDPKKKLIYLELLDIQAAAGAAIVPVDHPEVLQRVSVSEEWAQQEFGGKLSRIRLITARGDSMQGTIQDGDVLFVDASVQHYTSEGIYVLWDGEGVQVKRLQRLIGGGLRIISDNPTYPPQDAPSLTVLGRVLGAWNLRKFN